MALKVGTHVDVHYRSALVHGTITSVVKDTGNPATTAYMVHEVHTTVDGRKLVHNVKHYGSALHVTS